MNSGGCILRNTQKSASLDLALRFSVSKKWGILSLTSAHQVIARPQSFHALQHLHQLCQLLQAWCWSGSSARSTHAQGAHECTQVRLPGTWRRSSTRSLCLGRLAALLAHLHSEADTFCTRLFSGDTGWRVEGGLQEQHNLEIPFVLSGRSGCLCVQKKGGSPTAF